MTGLLLGIGLGLTGLAWLVYYLNRLVPPRLRPLVLLSIPTMLLLTVQWVSIRPNRLIALILAFFVTLLLYQFSRLSRAYWLQRYPATTLSYYLSDNAHRLARIMLLIGFVLYSLSWAGYSVNTLIAGLGLGGIAIALAAKDTLATLFGSVIIAIDRPFYRGDYILVDAIEGTVEDIGLRSTQMRTPLDAIITVPNSLIATTAIENRGKRRYRRVRFTLVFSHETSLETLSAFIASVKTIIHDSPVIREQATHTAFSEFLAHGLGVYISYFLKVDTLDDELKYKEDINYKIMVMAQRMKLEFAKPLL